MKIPAMGFSEYFIQSVTAEPTDANKSSQVDSAESATTGNAQKSDQEILESIEDIYFNAQSDPQMYELRVSWRDMIIGTEFVGEFAFYLRNVVIGTFD